MLGGPKQNILLAPLAVGTAAVAVEIHTCAAAVEPIRMIIDRGRPRVFEVGYIWLQETTLYLATELMYPQKKTSSGSYETIHIISYVKKLALSKKLSQS